MDVVLGMFIVEKTGLRKLRIISFDKWGLNVNFGLFSVPFLLDFTSLNFDDTVIFTVAICAAVLFNCEAQGYVATFLGDVEPDKNKRHHFNFLLHLDIKGTIAFFLGGFGWGKKVEIDPSNLKRPFIYTILIRISGPIANLLLANIICSIIWVLHRYEIQDKTLSIITAVNIMVAVYSLIPIPPLAAGSIITALQKKGTESFIKYFELAGPYIIIALILIERLGSVKIISHLNPIVIYIFKMIYI